MNKVIFITLLFFIAGIVGCLIIRHQLNIPIGVDCFPGPDMRQSREDGIEKQINTTQRIARDYFHYQPKVYCSSM